MLSLWVSPEPTLASLAAIFVCICWFAYKWYKNRQNMNNAAQNLENLDEDRSNKTIDDLYEDAVEHLMKFLTADEVMALGQTCSKWRDICQPVWREKKAKELTAAWSRVDHIPTSEEVATVELFLAQGLLTSQIITGKVAAVSEVWSRNHYFPTEAEVAFVALLASNGHISPQILAAKAAEIRGQRLHDVRQF